MRVSPERNRDAGSKKKIFIGVHEIAGNYTSLATGLRQLGYQVTLTFVGHHPFGYGAAQTIPSKEEELRKLRQRILNSSMPRPLTILLLGLLYMLRLTTKSLLRLGWAVNTFLKNDVFIFGFGTSLLAWNLDLPILKLSKKVLICNIDHGSEARPPAGDGAWLENEESVLSARELHELTEKNLKIVQTQEKYADFIVGNPLSTSYFARKPFVNTYFLGRPLDTAKYESFFSVASPQPGQKLSILHAPSHAPCKGTREIENILSDLRKEGFDFTYVRAENLSNSEILTLISQCDILIDQVYSDRYWPKVSAEAALLGTPAVIGGYGFDFLDSITPESIRPPVLAVHPKRLKDAVEDLLNSSSSREEMGRLARNFAHTLYSSEQVASNYALLFESGKVPKEWWIDPQEVDYLGGCGQHLDRTIENYRRMVAELGVWALGLDHKPKFRAHLLDFIANESAGRLE